MELRKMSYLGLPSNLDSETSIFSDNKAALADIIVNNFNVDFDENQNY